MALWEIGRPKLVAVHLVPNLAEELQEIRNSREEIWALPHLRRAYWGFRLASAEVQLALLYDCFWTQALPWQGSSSLSLG